MRTINATVQWPDQSSIAAVMKAESPDLTEAVEWSGDAQRIESRPPELREALFPSSFQNFLSDWATATGGRLEITAAGTFEIWAE